jgi:hypothetical protein
VLVCGCAMVNALASGVKCSRQRNTEHQRDSLCKDQHCLNASALGAKWMMGRR